jgi:predicted GH43/DUF377 family glycosyl hydrolase
MAEYKKTKKKEIKNKKRAAKKIVKKKVKATKKVGIKKSLSKKPKTTKSKLKLKTKKILKKKNTKPKLLRPQETKTKHLVSKYFGNPIMAPRPNSFWESEGVFNPGAIVHNGRVHLFYRALGSDGLSRIGYASSKDGLHFDERIVYPVFIAEERVEAMKHHPYTSPARLIYDQVAYVSGGGWGGSEDPRVVKIDGNIYMTFNMFNGWESMRVAVTSINEKDFEKKNWNWMHFNYLSHPGDRQKNWVLFPEKINGKFAVFHNLDMGDPSKVHIAYAKNLHMSEMPFGAEAPDPQRIPDHIVAWHNRTRSASAPPIKTKYGWLLFYHAMDKDDPGKYKVGAMILDLKNPESVLYRSSKPVLGPDAWYENDWKPGIIYASGAVVKDGILFIYYGGGDKHIAVAYENLEKFLQELVKKGNAVLSKKLKLKI